MKKHEVDTEVVYLEGAGNRPREIFTIKDTAGKVIHTTVRPLMILVHSRDVVQMIVGASLLAVPLVYAEETWRLGETLPLNNVIILGLISLCFVALFTYYTFYRDHLRGHVLQFFKRIITNYFITLCIIALFLMLVEQAPWATDWVLAIKRIIIIAVPASMSAAVADMIK